MDIYELETRISDIEITAEFDEAGNIDLDTVENPEEYAELMRLARMKGLYPGHYGRKGLTNG